MRWFHMTLLIFGTIFVPVVVNVLINMYTSGAYPGSGTVLIVCVLLQLALAAAILKREHDIREPAVVLLQAEDTCHQLVATKREMTRRDEAYRMVRSAFDALNQQGCSIANCLVPFSDGLKPIVEKFTASMWTVLGCTSNRYTIEAYFDFDVDGGQGNLCLDGNPMVFFTSPITRPDAAVVLGNRHPARLNWTAGSGRDLNEIKNLPVQFLKDGKADSAVYFNRYAVVTIPTQCGTGRLGLLVLTADQTEPLAENVLDTLDFLATIISAFHTKYIECGNLQKLNAEMGRLRAVGKS